MRRMGRREFCHIDKAGTGRRIGRLMEEANLKPADVQQSLHLTCVQTVYRWLEGVNVPSVDNLYALSQLFDVRMDDMVFGNRWNEQAFIDARIGPLLVSYAGKIIGRSGTA